jgi:hypothetical protein
MPIIFSVFFFILTAIFSYGQGVWIEKTTDPLSQLRKGKIEVNGQSSMVRWLVLSRFQTAKNSTALLWISDPLLSLDKKLLVKCFE